MNKWHNALRELASSFQKSFSLLNNHSPNANYKQYVAIARVMEDRPKAHQLHKNTSNHNRVVRINDNKRKEPSMEPGTREGPKLY